LVEVDRRRIELLRSRRGLGSDGEEAENEFCFRDNIALCTAAAKRFLEKVFSLRVINVDKNPAYPAAVEALKAEGTLAEFVCGSANISTMSLSMIRKGRVWRAGLHPTPHAAGTTSRPRSAR
jgi:hypothetical protein